MNITDALAGTAGLAGVQWALLDPEPHEVLRQALAGLLPEAGWLRTCRIHRAKYKPGRHLTAYYELGLRDPATGAESTRQVEVSWRPAGVSDPRGAADAIRAMQEEILARGLAAPFRQLTAEVPAWGLWLQIAPLDVAFPQLARVSDPAHVRGMLATAVPNELAIPENPVNPVILSEAPGTYSVTAIRYRPGQRHVLRYDPAGVAGRTEGDGTVFVKIYNSDKGARTFSVVTRVAEWLAAHGAGMTAVRPIAYLAEDGAVLYPHVSGTPLSHLLQEPGPALDGYLRQSGAALRALHRTPTTLVELQPHSFEKEIKGIVSAGEHIHALLPAVHARIGAILERARALHARLPQEQPGFAYGDFKADHLWVTPAGLTLIDFDTCYLADQAIDLGKFLSDLQWWHDRYGLAGVEQTQTNFLAGYGVMSPALLARARLYEVLVLVKTTARRVRLFDGDWAVRTERLIDRADTLLARQSLEIRD